jgi:hypothetical protein
MPINKTSLALLVFGALAGAQTKPSGVPLASLPAAVQQTIQANLQGAQVQRIGKEKVGSATQYEIETVLRGKARNFDVDAKGKLLVVEEEISLTMLPPAARTAIEQRIGKGQLKTVETVTKPGEPSLYEAGYTDGNGKAREVLVTGAGAPAKD